jgi:hypothetical protein
MKKTIEKEVLFCDYCGNETQYSEECMSCGKDMCYECSQKHGTSYSHAVYFSGSGDGFFCNPCDSELTAKGTDKRHSAYRAIQSLKLALKAEQENTKRRIELAESNLRRLCE